MLSAAKPISAECYWSRAAFRPCLLYTSMCLAAYDKGIASCWVEAVVRAGNALGSHFATGHGKLIGAIVLGYADMEPRPIKQKGARYVIR